MFVKSVAFACAGFMLLPGFLLAQKSSVETAWNLLAKGQRNEAVQLLRQLTATNPSDADCRLLLGSVLAEAGDRPGAIEHLTAAVRLRPQSAEAHNALGEAFNGFGESKAAREEFEKAVVLDPRFVQSRVNLGQTLVEAGAFEPAAKHLDRALELLGGAPDAAYPHYLRAKVCAEQNDMATAAVHLGKAVMLRPDFPEAWSDLGQARKALLDDVGALAAFERAVALGPDDAVAQYRLGSEYLHQGKTHAAVTHLLRASSLKPEDQSTLYSLQLALREDGQPAESKQVRAKLSELLVARDKAAQSALAAVQLNNQGAALEKAGNLAAALDKYRAALELNPEQEGFRVNLAAALLRLGRWEQGIAALREALRRNPGNAAVKSALDAALARSPVKP